LLLDKYKDSLNAKLNVKSHVITNAVQTPAYVHPIAQREKVIIAVGRLSEQKRFDRLIDAVYLIKDKMRELGWVAEIYGEGSLEGFLNNKIISLNLSDLISLKGNVDNIDAVMNNSSVYVMPSEFEGLSLAMLEALSYALPVICFEECLGVEDIVVNNHNGFVVNDINAFAKALECYISDFKVVEVHSLNAKLISEKFSMNNMFNGWDSMVRDVLFADHYN
jgi:glycosyltransferase involved in cell wall biosynthesis